MYPCALPYRACAVERNDPTEAHRMAMSASEHNSTLSHAEVDQIWTKLA